MNRPLSSVVLLVLAFGLGCAIGKKDKGGTDGDGVAQDPVCVDYLDCITEVEPSTVGALLETYGEDGTCWTSRSSADACAEACEAALSAAHQLYPGEAACDDGSELNSLTLLGAATDWNFALDDLDPDCEYEAGAIDLDGTIQGSDSAAFTFDGEIEAYSLFGEVGVFPVELDCTLDGYDFGCEAATFEEIDLDGALYENIVELSGTFGSTYETADAEAEVTLKHDGDTICTAVTTFSGTAD